LGVLVVPDGAAPPLALVELPEGEAPPLALVEVPAGVEVEVALDAPVEPVDVPIVELAPGAVEVLSELAALEPLMLECEEPPQPAITRKAARSAEKATKRLTFPA
jgi:hypothetical protein